MRKIGVLFFIISLILITSPVSAGQDNLYTAVTHMNLEDIEQIVPHTIYRISYKYEIWSERITDLRPEILDIEEENCLLNISITTTSDIGSSSHCTLNSKSASEYSNGTIYQSGITETNFIRIPHLYRNGLHVAETDSGGSNFPDGNITFAFEVVEPAVSEIFGDNYGFTMVTIQGSNSFVFDRIPYNYGANTSKETDYLHFRMVSANTSYISPVDDTFTEFTFKVKAAILNNGPGFTKRFSTSTTQFLCSDVDLDGLEYTTGHLGGFDVITLRQYEANSFTEFEYYYSVKIRDELVEFLPDGTITLWFDTIYQPEENTYRGYLEIKNGEIFFDHDPLPEFWYLYDTDLSITHSEVSFYYSSFVLLIPIALIYNNKKITQS